MGPEAVAGLRVALATLILWPVALWWRQVPSVRGRWALWLLLGLTNSALPFWLYSVAAQHIAGGLMSILNATTPLWSATIAWLWLGDRLNRSRVLGLGLGLMGVIWLAADRVGVRSGAQGAEVAWSIGACLLATFCYGWAANLTKRFMQGQPALGLAMGSQAAATLLLILPTLTHWPDTAAPAVTWGALAALGFLCTGVAYLLYFRLITQLGAAKATSVTFLIPVFAVIWGAVFLGERIDAVMLGASSVILLGTSLAVGLWRIR